MCIEVAEPLYVVEAAFKAKDLFLPDDPHCGPYYWAWDGCSHWLGRPPGAGLEPWSCWLWWSTDLILMAEQARTSCPSRPLTTCHLSTKRPWRLTSSLSHLPRLAEELGAKEFKARTPAQTAWTDFWREASTKYLAGCLPNQSGRHEKCFSRIQYLILSFLLAGVLSFLFSFVSHHVGQPVLESSLGKASVGSSSSPAQRPWNTAIRFHRAVSEVSYIGNLSIQSYFNCMMAAEIKSEPHDSQNKVHQNISGRGQAGSNSHDLGTWMNSVKLTMARNCRRFRWAKPQGSGLPEPNAAGFNHFWGNVPSRSWAWTWSWNKTLGSVVWLKLPCSMATASGCVEWRRNRMFGLCCQES